MSPEVDEKKFDPPGPNWLWRWIWKLIKRKGDKLLDVDQPKKADGEKEVIGPKTQFNTGRLDWRREQQKKEKP